MSATSSPNESPSSTPIQPLHNPAQAAHVVLPQAPLGNVANQAQQHPLPSGLAAKALLNKKMSNSLSSSYQSPTDTMMTPVSQKLAAAKQKHFNKAKPMQLFAQKEEAGEQENIDSHHTTKTKSTEMLPEDDLPF